MTPPVPGRQHLRHWLLAPLALSLCALLAACSPSPSAGDEPTSTRKLLLPDGGRYQGQLLKGQMHGEGRIDWAGGRSYVGQFHKGYLQGQGVYTSPSYVYEGQFHQGQMHGQGKLKSTRQDYQYEGQFASGMMHGQGKLEQEGGYSYEGEFAKDEPRGQGRITESDGTVIEGRFRDMQPEGQVLIIAPDGQRYEGPVMGGRIPHGQGRLTRADQAVVRGEFVYGSLQNPAHIDYPDGARYHGEVEHNQAHGQGELRQSGGHIYKGQFHEDRMHGKGQLRRADKSVQTGYWRKGQYQGEQGEDVPPDTAELAARNNEALLYNQAQLLQEQFDQLQASPAGEAPRLYALYVAGDGRQEVFRREVTHVDALMARRFDTRGRSISLVNSRSSAHRLPLATAHSIEQALSALAQKMNRERDLLFVYLTSHGSQQHELSLGMPRMALPDLPAERLGQMLKASGIRKQVVVVSACYSGGFVPALRGEHTWVITAARADRSSFGCTDDNDFTYFGRALFEQALPTAPTLSAAFEQARKHVRELEQRDQLAARSSPAAASDGAPSAASAAASQATEDEPLAFSEPLSEVSPAFRAEVDAWVRSHAPVAVRQAD